MIPNSAINRKLKNSLRAVGEAEFGAPAGAPYNSPAVEPRKGRNPGNRPKKQMRTPEGWHKARRKNAALFQNAANTNNTRPQRLRAPLRYGPRHYMSPQVPWVLFHFLLIYRGSGLRVFAFYALAGRSLTLTPPPA